MNVKQPAREHPLQKFATEGAQQLIKVEQLRAAAPGRNGAFWAQQAIALCMQQATAWTQLAHELFPMTTEEREAAIKAWRDWKTAKVKARKSGEEQSPKMDDKMFNRIMATATQRLTNMSTIAKALDSGMTTGGIAQFYAINVEDVGDLSIDALYQVALTFSKSVAGRKPDAFLVKLGKFLEKNKPTAESPEQDIADYNKVVSFLNSLTD